LEQQLATAIYLNRRNHLVICQQGSGDDEDAFIIIAPQNIAAFIDRIRDLTGSKAGKR
jgi:hypothetical protein